MRFFAVALIFFGVAASYAQTPEVPHKMHFADMTLTIRDDARREIQKDVDALTKSPKYFNIKVERARTYFPIIEKIFEEERLPDDFKYLALQESALIPDAVSVSNAVGFWQFKDFTALEMGLRVDGTIDERMNIVSASRAAAKYIKQNNYMFNNWIYALQAYQMGAGGVKRLVGDDHNGARHMDITSETYWYVKKYLAHKVAFEKVLEQGEPQLKMQVFPINEEKSLSQLAKQMAIEENELLTYNRWIKSGKIPGDKTYSIVVPLGKVSEEFNTLMIATTSTKTIETNSNSTKAIDQKKEINGILAVKGVKGESATQMATRIEVPLSDFLKYNEISIDHPIRSDVYYFTKKKKNKTKGATHKVVKGDDVWLVSQQHGVMMKRIQKLNRYSSNQVLYPGEIVYLSTKRPLEEISNQRTESALSPQIVTSITSDESYFDWVVDSSVPQKNTASQLNKSNTNENIAISDTSSAAVPAGMHQVAPGETLYSLSKKYQVAVTDLLTWNDLDIKAGIKPGQLLVIQDPTKPDIKEEVVKEKKPASIITHEVKSADTLYSVARQYNVSIKDIMDWNGKQDFSLAVGEKLKIFVQ